MLTACKKGLPDYSDLQAFNTDGTINLVVEVPAGSTENFFYSFEEKEFIADTLVQNSRYTNLLPYPVCQGFIINGGQKLKGINAMLLAPSLPMGTIVPAKPLALVKLKVMDEYITNILFTPVDSSIKIIETENFSDFSLNHRKMKYMLEQWFYMYHEGKAIDRIYWRDERSAEDFLRKKINDKR